MLCAATYSGTCGEKLNWSFDDETSVLNITGSGAMTNWNAGENVPWYSIHLKIKSIVFPEGLTTIGNYAFLRCYSLASIELPQSLTAVGSYSFSKCTKLSSIVIPDGVISIGAKAFSECSAVTSISIPGSVVSIGESAFYYCSALTTIEIPTGIQSIGDKAFNSCGALTTISIPNTVQYIGEQAFTGCRVLTGVNIPASVTIIGENAFSSCNALNYINVNDGNPNYASEDGVLFDKNKETLILYPAGNARSSYTIPNSVTTIKQRAFIYCRNLLSVTIPNNVTDIEDEAFIYCTSMTSINIPTGINEIGFEMLYGCSSLTSLKIPNNITSIGEAAMGWCSSLSSLILPAGITSIGNGAFYHCVSLTSVTCKSTTPPTIGEDVFGEMDTNIPLYVPAGSIELYQAANGWSEFNNILAIEEIATQEGEYNILYIDKNSEELHNETATLHVPVAPTIEGFTFLRWDVIAGQLSDGIVIQAIYTANVPTEAPAAYTNPANPAQKLIRNGNVYILTGDKTYTVTGQEVK